MNIISIFFSLLFFITIVEGMERIAIVELRNRYTTEFITIRPGLGIVNRRRFLNRSYSLLDARRQQVIQGLLENECARRRQ